MTTIDENYGWIKIFRRFLKWEWYDDINTKTVFLHLLLTANYETKKWHGIEIKRGQRLVSLPNLAKETNLTISQIRTSLKHLKLTHEVTCQVTQSYTLVTIEKYSVYQEGLLQSDTVNDTLNDTVMTR